jgi:hypothetical protein
MTKAGKAPRFAGIGGHQSARSMTVEWGTPHELPPLLGEFDLDPCAPIDYPHRHARRHMTILDDGLLLPWRDEDGRKLRVLLNPPYDDVEAWLAKMALHDRGTALIFARTETVAFHRHVWQAASALLFMRGRINFRVIEPFSRLEDRRTFSAGDVAPGNAGAPTVLCAYGADDADVLAACDVDGQFVPLRVPRSLFVSWASKAVEKTNTTWADEVAGFFAGREGPVELAELYRHFSAHPKAAANRNVDAKVRQQLQRGAYRRVAPGLWEARR